MGRTLNFYFALKTLRLFVFIMAGVFTLIWMIDSVELLRRGFSDLLGGVGQVLWLSARRSFVILQTVLPFVMLLTAIFSFIGLNRSRELVVVRGAGLSVWQFIAPLCVVAILCGAFAAFVVNPLAAWANNTAERQETLARSGDTPIVTSDNSQWVRQAAGDETLLIGHRGATNQGRLLADVTFFVLDKEGRIDRRITARRAAYSDGKWILTSALTSVPGEGPRESAQVVIETDADASRLNAQSQSPEMVSIFGLKQAEDVAAEAGLSRDPYRQALHSGLAKPLFFLAMVIVASTICLRFGRFGRYETMVLGGMIGGFLIYILVEIFDGLGGAGTLPPLAAVWVPLSVVIMGAATVLLHQEDG